VADRTNRDLWVEVGVVLIVLLLPTYYSIVADLIGPSGGGSSGDEFSSPRDILRDSINDTSRSALLLYLMWRSGESWHRFGFTRFGWTRSDTSIALGILLINFGIEELVALVEPVHIEDKGGRDSSTSPGTALLIVEYILFVIHICIAAFYEELLMRGYLIPRFEHLLRSTWTSLFLTALLFGGFHMDQGMGGVLGITLAGLVYGGAFCWFRRLWPVATAHAVYNLVVMLLPRLTDTPVM
jgi:membrane protease YdiL (CAAX protease family)